MDMKPADQPGQAVSGKQPMSRVQRMTAGKFLCNVNDKRALIGLSLLVTSHFGQMRDTCHIQAFTIVLCNWFPLHIHSFILQRYFVHFLENSKCALDADSHVLTYSLALFSCPQCRMFKLIFETCIG